MKKKIILVGTFHFEENVALIKTKRFFFFLKLLAPNSHFLVVFLIDNYLYR